MLVGVFADTHDHLDNIRRVVRLFNEAQVELILFAGDLVSTFAVPPLRQLNAPVWGCFGDNEGNKPGLLAGFSIIGILKEAPAEFTLPDGTRVVVVHMQRDLRGYTGEFDAAIMGHTHKPSVKRDEAERLWINPGESSGWTYGNPTVALWETTTGEVDIVPLSEDVDVGQWHLERRELTKRGTNSE
ncbi:MAG: YfcE family phosphodiesterase [Planctomycetaceae bacterium]|nr:YfcE family phosphodiesterase [Planctomycetaceae bacterium]